MSYQLLCYYAVEKRRLCCYAVFMQCNLCHSTDSVVAHYSEPQKTWQFIFDYNFG